MTFASAQTVPEVNQERMPGMFTVASLVGPTFGKKTRVENRFKIC
jgi:hypothetical protein